MSDRHRERARDVGWWMVGPWVVLVCLIGPEITLLALRHAFPRWMSDATEASFVAYWTLRLYQRHLLRTADRLDREGVSE